MRARGEGVAMPVETADSDEDMELYDHSDDDSINDPDFNPASSDDEPVAIDRVDAEVFDTASDDEAECVLEIEAPGEINEPASTSRGGRANARRSSQPQWVKGTGSDETQFPSFQQSYELDGTLKQPIEYFKSFFTEEIFQIFVDQSNLYSTQKNVNKPLDVTVQEFEQWLGLTIHFSVSKLPSCRMHWDTSLGLYREFAASYMSRDRFLEIKSNLHLVDNNSITSYEDKLVKIRPLVNHLRAKFQNIPMDQELCIDEQMVPFKGASQIKQYIPSKPNKWGYKLFVLADKSEMIHDFIPYTGKIEPVNCEGVPDLKASANVVLHLAQIIPNNKNHILYFDNWFSSISLLDHLASRGIYSCGTIRAPRITGLPKNKTAEKDFIAKGQGSHNENKTTNLANEVTHVQWFDNKIVNLVSTFAKAKPLQTVQRFSRKERRVVDVPRPSIVGLYNQGMGGVDLADGMISLYRIFLRSRKYYQRLIFHLVDLALLNSWNCYRRDAKFLELPKSKILKYAVFKMQISSDLLQAGKPSRKRGRPQATPKRKPSRHHCAMPTQTARHDKVDHFPSVDKVRRMCKNDGCSGKTNIVCSKCKVNLCLNAKANCFTQFHGA